MNGEGEQVTELQFIGAVLTMLAVVMLVSAAMDGARFLFWRIRVALRNRHACKWTRIDDIKLRAYLAQREGQS